MALRCEMTLVGADQTDQQEDCPNQNMHAMEACGHKEVGEGDLTRERPAINNQQFMVLIDLKCCENSAKSNRQDQPHAQVFAVIVMHQSVVGPGVGTS